MVLVCTVWLVWDGLSEWGFLGLLFGIRDSKLMGMLERYLTSASPLILHRELLGRGQLAGPYPPRHRPAIAPVVYRSLETKRIAKGVQQRMKRLIAPTRCQLGDAMLGTQLKPESRSRQISIEDKAKHTSSRPSSRDLGLTHYVLQPEPPSKAVNNRRKPHQHGNEVCNCATFGDPPCKVNGSIGVKVFNDRGDHVGWEKATVTERRNR